jgi:hypothetical protein
MNTKSFVGILLIIAVVFGGVIYWRWTGASDEVLELAQAKRAHWETADGGMALYPEVVLDLIDPPLDGAGLRISGSIIDEASKAVLVTYLEQEDPKLLPDEYVLDVKVGARAVLAQDSAGSEETGPDFNAPIVLPFENNQGTGTGDKKLQSPFSSDLLFGEEKRPSWAPESGSKQQKSEVADSEGGSKAKKSLGEILNSVR